MKKLPAPKTVAEIAALLGGVAAGDAAAVITAVAEVASAGPSDVASFHNMKYVAAAQASRAGCLLVPPAAAGAACAAKAKIVVADPQASFAVLLGLVDGARRAGAAAGVSPKASVHPEAKLGAGVSVGDFSVIERGAVIGAGTVVSAQCFIGEEAKVGEHCLLHPRVVVRHECELGDRVTLHPGVVIGGDGFGFTTDPKTGRHTKIPQIGNVIVGSGVEIGANTTIDRATLGSTVIEPGAQIDNLVQVAHNVRIGAGAVLVSQVGVAGSTVVGRGAVLAGQAGIAGHLTIGDGAVITAQTGVMADVPAKTVLFGSPGRPHREAFKLQALYGRLPEFVERLKEIEKKLGIGGKTDAAA
ncbi:MAG TPA: UDP-3-O-(3-hydroxymyristoyl)glucosamine N-acyltransferase [Elusimicrobiota bacterium]|nr:UDP-3-O-(3-hydroxymyristoyl)glucosamine N-acyltransferase [Elusimicrobiota bacterium]